MVAAAAAGAAPQAVDSGDAVAGPVPVDLTIDDAVARIEALLQADDIAAAERLSSDISLQCAPAVYAAGVLALARREIDAAITLFRAATLLAPNVAEFHLCHARALLQNRDLERCADAARTALAMEPSATAHRTLGRAYALSGKQTEASTHLAAVTELEPSDPLAWSALGESRLLVDDLDAATAAFRKAVELDPARPEGWLNLGRASAHQGRTGEALEAIRRARELQPDAPHINSNLLFTLSDAIDVTSEQVCEEHRRWGTRLVELVGPPRTEFPNERDPARRLRIGYVSADFRRHPVAFFTGALFGLHDRRSFEIAAYSNNVNADQTTWQIRSRADRWVDIAALPDEAVTERIRGDAIDILVDLSGHTAGDRLGVFARRAAPIQITYLGYTNTTGLPTMDYRITDRWSDPPGETEHLYTESLVRPFESFVCYTPPAGTHEVSALPAWRNGYVTFGSFNRGRKINPAVAALWSRVLKAVPGSRLFLKHAASCRRPLLELFAEHGVADRLDFAECDAVMRDHMASYEAIDVALDTFPWNGITTTCEAMWMGVPVLALAGTEHRSRAGVSLLNNVGLPELVAHSHGEYVDLAVRLTADTDELATLRAGLRERMRRSPLMDAEGFTRAVERTYRETWAQWCAQGGE